MNRRRREALRVLIDHQETSSKLELAPPAHSADESALDYILFEDEEPAATMADLEVSANVRKTGKLRRALSRKKSAIIDKSQAPDSLQYPPTSTEGPRSYPSQLPNSSFEEQRLGSHDRSYSPSRPAPSPLKATYSDPYLPPPGLFPDDRLSPAHGQVRPGMPSPLHSSYAFNNSPSMASSLYDAEMPSRPSVSHSLRGLLSQSELGLGKDEVDDVFLDVEGRDREDLDVIAEFAREGRPNFGVILDEEIERSHGKTMVACCGPISLNLTIRNLVAHRISPARIRRGDPRGQIDLGEYPRVLYCEILYLRNGICSLRRL